MDLTLSLSYEEQNDNKAIILTDTGNYGQSGDTLSAGDKLVVGTLYQIQTVGSGSTAFSTSGSSADTVGYRFIATAATTLNTGDSCIEVTPYASEITAADISIIITDSTGTASSTYTVDLYSEFGPFVSQADLKYTLDDSYFDGSNGDELTDGIYAMTYGITYQGTNQSGSTTADADDLEVTALVYGVVKVKVYDKLRQITTSYQCKDCDTKRTILEADFAFAYLEGIEKSAYTGKTEELVLMLSTLESILNNGSYIVW